MRFNRVGKVVAWGLVVWALALAPIRALAQEPDDEAGDYDDSGLSIVKSLGNCYRPKLGVGRGYGVWTPGCQIFLSALATGILGVRALDLYLHPASKRIYEKKMSQDYLADYHRTERELIELRLAESPHFAQRLRLKDQEIKELEAELLKAADAPKVDYDKLKDIKEKLDVVLVDRRIMIEKPSFPDDTAKEIVKLIHARERLFLQLDELKQQAPAAAHAVEVWKNGGGEKALVAWLKTSAGQAYLASEPGEKWKKPFFDLMKEIEKPKAETARLHKAVSDRETPFRPQGEGFDTIRPSVPTVFEGYNIHDPLDFVRVGEDLQARGSVKNPHSLPAEVQNMCDQGAERLTESLKLLRIAKSKRDWWYRPHRLALMASASAGWGIWWAIDYSQKKAAYLAKKQAADAQRATIAGQIKTEHELLLSTVDRIKPFTQSAYENFSAEVPDPDNEGPARPLFEHFNNFIAQKINRRYILNDTTRSTLTAKLKEEGKIWTEPSAEGRIKNILEAALAHVAEAEGIKDLSKVKHYLYASPNSNDYAIGKRFLKDVFQHAIQTIYSDSLEPVVADQLASKYFPALVELLKEDLKTWEARHGAQQPLVDKTTKLLPISARDKEDVGIHSSGVGDFPGLIKDARAKREGGEMAPAVITEHTAQNGGFKDPGPVAGVFLGANEGSDGK